MIERSDTRSERISFCRLCPGSCGIVVEVEGEHVVRVKGDPDHPLSQGYTCSKGRALGYLHEHPARLNEPRVQGAVSAWDAAIDYIGDRVRLAVAQDGPEAVGMYQGTHWAFDSLGRRTSSAFMRSLGSSQIYSTITVDGPNKSLVSYLVAGTPYLFPVVDWEHANVVILVGQNPVVSHGHAVSRPNPVVALRNVRQRGGSIVVIDPRLTETAKVADIHAAVRPGTDVALLAYLARRVLGHLDTEYLDACVEPASLRRLQEILPRFERRNVIEICGIASSTLSAIEAVVLRPGRVAIQTGTGISMGRDSNLGEWLTWVIGALTGSLDRVGGLLFNPGVLRPQERRMINRRRVTGTPTRSRPELDHLFGERPCVVLPDEILSGSLKILIVIGGNPLLALPDSSRMKDALSALDLLVVCDIVANEMTELADVVLPVAGSLERPDLTLALDLTFPQPFVQFTKPVVAVAASRRPLWQIFNSLMIRMGLPEGRLELSEDELLAAASASARLPWPSIAGAEHGLLDDTAPSPGWLIPGRLPNGRLELAPPELADELERWIAPSGQTSLVLINRRLPHQVNSLLRDVTGQIRAPFPTLLIHPDDARRLSARTGDIVQVSGESGSASATVEISDAIRPGVVSLPHGHSSPAINLLTSNTRDVDPKTGMPRFSGIPVRIERLAGP